MSAITYPGPELDELVLTLMACTPLGELWSMQARTVFELLLQRGWRITRISAHHADIRPCEISSRCRVVLDLNCDGKGACTQQLKF